MSSSEVEKGRRGRASIHKKAAENRLPTSGCSRRISPCLFTTGPASAPTASTTSIKAGRSQSATALNAGRLPPGYFAMIESKAVTPEPDVIALELNPSAPSISGGMAVDLQPPKAWFVTRSEAAGYARKANRITVRHPDGDVAAILEIVSPGNKDSRHAIRAFARKAVEFLQAGVHLLIVDLFPPGRRDPQGIHKVIWDHIHDEPFTLPPDKPLTAGGLRGRDRDGRLCRASRRRRCPAGHAHLPDRGSLGALSAGGDLPDGLGAVSRTSPGASGVAADAVSVSAPSIPNPERRLAGQSDFPVFWFMWQLGSVVGREGRR